MAGIAAVRGIGLRAQVEQRRYNGVGGILRRVGITDKCPGFRVVQTARRLRSSGAGQVHQHRESQAERAEFHQIGLTTYLITSGRGGALFTQGEVDQDVGKNLNGLSIEQGRPVPPLAHGLE